MSGMPLGRGEAGDDAPMPLDGLSPRKEIVRVFYKEMWDRADTSLIPAIVHEDFTFRGSLGPVLRAHDEFAGYVDWVTTALGDYTSDILVLVEEGDRVAGKLRFHGIHRREMFGIAPTGLPVWWYGAPIFTFEGERVRDLFVFGDVHGLVGRLRAAATAGGDPG